VRKVGEQARSPQSLRKVPQSWPPHTKSGCENALIGPARQPAVVTSCSRRLVHVSCVLGFGSHDADLAPKEFSALYNLLRSVRRRHDIPSDGHGHQYLGLLPNSIFHHSKRDPHPCLRVKSPTCSSLNLVSLTPSSLLGRPVTRWHLPLPRSC